MFAVAGYHAVVCDALIVTMFDNLIYCTSAKLKLTTLTLFPSRATNVLCSLESKNTKRNLVASDPLLKMNIQNT